jgi:uncharacterized protein (TIGR03435 family)
MRNDLALCVLIAESLAAQTAAAPPAFEVVSVKLSEPFTPSLAQSPGFRVGMKISGQRVDIGRMRLVDLIALAYGLKQNQIIGPTWLNSTQEIFDIAAIMPEGATSPQAPLMLQAMLAERFKLIAHRETRERSGYALVQGKDGAKLEAAGAGPDPTAAAQKGSSLNGRGAPAPRQSFNDSDGDTTHYVNPQTDMARLAAMLEPILDQPVIDRTGLKGFYKIGLDIPTADMRRMFAVPAAMADADVPAAPSGKTILTSLRAMGLTLEPQRIQLEVLVVDRAESRPTAN